MKEAVKQLKRLFGESANTLLICLMFLPVNGQPPTHEFATLEELTTDKSQAHIEKLNETCNVYASMAMFAPGTERRKKESIAECSHVFFEVDHDGEASLAAVRAAVESGEVPEPTLILESSPEKFQFIWNVEGFDVAACEAMNRSLAAHFGGDRASTDAARVLRVAGFRNLKYEAKPVVKIISLGDFLDPLFRSKHFQIPMEPPQETVEYSVASEGEVNANIGFLRAALDAAGMEVKHTKQWGEAGLLFELVECSWSDVHTQNEFGGTDNIMGGCAAYVFDSGAYDFKCLHDHCADRNWNDFKDYLISHSDVDLQWGEPGGKIVFPKSEKFVESGNSPPKSKPVPAVKVNTIYTALEFKRPAVEGTPFDFVVAPAMGQKDGWFPRGDVHLIGGASGSSKSTLMLDLLKTQQGKQPYLGHETFGLSYYILMADRGRGAFIRTSDRMNFDPKVHPSGFLPSVWGDVAIHTILDKIEALDAIPAVLFVEGMDGLVENPNKMEIVTPFLNGLQKIAEHYHISIIGSVGSPKVKMGEGYASMRDKVFGTVQWGRKTETVLVLQFAEGDDTSVNRDLAVLLRNAPAQKYKLKMENGRLVQDVDAPENTVIRIKEKPEITWFREQGETWFTAEDFMESMGLKKSQAYTKLENALTKNIIKTKQKLTAAAREYRWNDGPNNPELKGPGDIILAF